MLGKGQGSSQPHQNRPVAKQTEADEMLGKVEYLFSFVTFGWFTFKLTGCNIDC